MVKKIEMQHHKIVQMSDQELSGSTGIDLKNRENKSRWQKGKYSLMSFM